MSGHSKWANIKHRKAAVDAKRGKIFTKLIRELTVAARAGGGDPDTNPRLRLAISMAKAQNMPKDTIERAIKRGTGEIGGEELHEVTYEGYGPGGIAVLVQVLTDNKNRAVADIRRIFTKYGGNLGESGCVAWIFGRKGRIAFGDSLNEEEIMEIAIEAGAEDVKEDGGDIVVITASDSFESVKEAFDRANLKYESAEITMIPQSTIRLEGKEAEQMLRIMEDLEDSDDVQQVYANFDIDEEIMEAFSQVA